VNAAPEQMALFGELPIEPADEYEELLCDYAELEVKLWAVGERLRDIERGRRAHLRLVQ
jgi:hypothetical protein